MSPHRKACGTIAKWIGDDAGSSAVEFALIMPLVIVLLGGMADLGIAIRERLKISGAASAAAMTALAEWSSVTSSTATDYRSKLKNVVSQNAGQYATVTTSILINGSTDNSAVSNYYCASGSPTTYAAASSSTSSCGGNVLGGKYVTISISGSIKPLFAVTASYAGNLLAIAESVTVRVE